MVQAPIKWCLKSASKKIGFLYVILCQMKCIQYLKLLNLRIGRRQCEPCTIRLNLKTDTINTFFLNKRKCLHYKAPYLFIRSITLLNSSDLPAYGTILCTIHQSLYNWDRDFWRSVYMNTNNTGLHIILTFFSIKFSTYITLTSYIFTSAVSIILYCNDYFQSIN